MSDGWKFSTSSVGISKKAAEDDRGKCYILENKERERGDRWQIRFS